MKRTLIPAFTLMALVACGAPATRPAAPAAQAEAGLEGWAKHYPEASNELGEWVKKYSEAAALFFQWDGQHPQAFQDFVAWVVANPTQPITVFVRAHRDWPEFSAENEEHRWAAEAFMDWCRKHPKAAEALTTKPGGLKWAGNNLYKAYWKMEN